MARRRRDGRRDRRVARRHQHGLPGQARRRRRVRLGADAGARDRAAAGARGRRARCRRTCPVTVKHRAGWDERHRNAPEFACAMVEAGAQMITVHGRTRTQGFSGKSDPGRSSARARGGAARTSRSSATATSSTVDDYLRMREETGCDAVMIGRGALGNPWLFSRLRDGLRRPPRSGRADARRAPAPCFAATSI